MELSRTLLGSGRVMEHACKDELRETSPSLAKDYPSHFYYRRWVSPLKAERDEEAAYCLHLTSMSRQW
ncbi:MAG: hypothetical protein MZV63_41145 [Marinilabiliales bacterium]|nr:hypothetical protein [Marinilabiliales bacterium]